MSELILPVFPLPNIVLFPGIVQPLHIYEPRYVQMIRDALNSDKMIGMVLLVQGWEKEYLEKPPVHDIICAGRIVKHEELPMGKFNIYLLGLSRAQIIEELETENLYRTVKAEVIKETGQKNLEQIKQFFLNVIDRISTGLKMPKGANISQITDFLASAVVRDVYQKQELLEESNVGERIKKLMKIVDFSRFSFTNVPTDQSLN